MPSPKISIVTLVPGEWGPALDAAIATDTGKTPLSWWVRELIRKELDRLAEANKAQAS